MYNPRKPNKTMIVANDKVIGETIEKKIERILNNEGSIGIRDGAPLIYTDRADGIRPEYNVRTDRFELAATAMDAISKNTLAKRKSTLEAKKKAETPKENPENPVG